MASIYPSRIGWSVAMTTFLTSVTAITSVTSASDPTSYISLNELLARTAGQTAGQARAGAPVSGEQLRALRRRWNAALSAQLDQAIEFAGARPLRDAVAEGWLRLADEQPALRAVLDAHPSGAPTQADHESRMLALAAGLVDLDASPGRATRLGAAYLAGIREGRATVPTH